MRFLALVLFFLPLAAAAAAPRAVSTFHSLGVTNRVTSAALPVRKHSSAV